MVFECIQSEPTQNRLRSIAIITSLTSVILSFISIERCTFILSGATTSPDDKLYAWGLFSTPVYDQDGNVQGCIPYPNYIHLGTAIKTSQAFGILLVIFATSIFLGLLMVQFFLERGTLAIYHIIKVLLPCAFCSQLLTFASFASKFCSEIVDEEDENKGTIPATCLPGGAGVAAMFNLVAIIVMAIVMSLVMPPDNPVFQLYGTGNSVRVVQKRNPSTARKGKQKKKKKKKRPPQGMEQYSMMEPKRPGKEKVKTTIVNGPNVRKTIKQITHADGSQTITTTVEEIQSYGDDDDDDDDDEDDDGECSFLADEESTILEVL